MAGFTDTPGSFREGGGVIHVQQSYESRVLSFPAWFLGLPSSLYSRGVTCWSCLEYIKVFLLAYVLILVVYFIPGSVKKCELKRAKILRVWLLKV